MTNDVKVDAQIIMASFHGLLITNLVFTDVKLGRGADATVFQVEWNGTVCAVKRLHDILLEDQSPGGVAKLIGNFEAECLTWSKLRHPGVVQFLGVYFERNSRLPVLVMEKMDTSLRTYLEDHSKEEFPLNLKALRPPSGDPSACLSPQPEPASRPSRLESEQRIVERGLFRDQGERFWHESSHQPIRPQSQVLRKGHVGIHGS